ISRIPTTTAGSRSRTCRPGTTSSRSGTATAGWNVRRTASTSPRRARPSSIPRSPRTRSRPPGRSEGAVFLSKIWFFLVALGAAVALTIALVMPRPAQRQAVIEEHNRLAVACGVVNILLSDDARNRVELAGVFARADEIVRALESASGVERLDATRMKQVRDTGEKLMQGISGRKPDFAMLIDRRGRVVAR